MTTIKYICSLGTSCHTSAFKIRNRLKFESYPFDWIISNPKMILHCLENDFKLFLDKSQYINIFENRSSHLIYGDIFHHHNLLDSNDYDYFVRSVNRFREIMKSEEEKLFIMTFTNIKNIVNIIEFNKEFSKNTKNYTLLVIYHFVSGVQRHNVSNIENILSLIHI